MQHEEAGWVRPDVQDVTFSHPGFVVGQELPYARHAIAGFEKVPGRARIVKHPRHFGHPAIGLRALLNNPKPAEPGHYQAAQPTESLPSTTACKASSTQPSESDVDAGAGSCHQPSQQLVHEPILRASYSGPNPLTGNSQWHRRPPQQQDGCG